MKRKVFLSWGSFEFLGLAHIFSFPRSDDRRRIDVSCCLLFPLLFV